MTRTKLDTPAFADQSVDTRNIKDGTIIAQDVSGSITNAKLANSSFTINTPSGATSLSLGTSTSIIPFLDWQAVTVADGSTTLSAVAGRGYFLDTNTGVIEVFLPTSPSRGDTIALVDYSGTFATNQLIINTGGQLIDSTSGPDFKVTTNNSIVELVYIDANKGWQVILNQAAGTTPDNALDTGGGYDSATFIGATGGTVTTSGNFKIHTFTGDGCFVVSSLGNSVGGPNNVSYLVVAGGGGGGAGSPNWTQGGGGGAGGFREGKDSADSYSVSPLVAPAGLPVSVQTYPVTVGSGGTAGTTPTPAQAGGTGSNSIFSTITSTGGGGGAGYESPARGTAGGSGGGGSNSSPDTNVPGLAGNTPPVSPSQGNAGGDANRAFAGPSAYQNFAGGGGGATAAGGDGGPTADSGTGGDGGAGGTTHITGSPVAYAGGGGGGGAGTNNSGSNIPGGAGSGGTGGGGNGLTSNRTNLGLTFGPTATGGAGTANTGGGGGGGASNGDSVTPEFGRPGGAGGKGIVVIRYKFQ